jgi:hypothetical protein
MLANPAWIRGFLFSLLPTIAGRCIRVRVKLRSTALNRGIAALQSCSGEGHTQSMSSTSKGTPAFSSPSTATPLDTLDGTGYCRRDGRSAGLGDLYSGPSLPLGGSSGRSHSEAWAGCIASLTNEGSSLLSASITLHAWVAVPTHQFPTTGRTLTTPTLRLIPPLLPRLAILAQRQQRISQRTLVHLL